MTAPVTGATRVAGIIGHPIGHSRSPAIWNSAFREAGADWIFVAFPVAPGDAVNALDGARKLGIAALTVTMPMVFRIVIDTVTSGSAANGKSSSGASERCCVLPWSLRPHA